MLRCTPKSLEDSKDLFINVSVLNLFEVKKMVKIKIAIAGVGNCASNFV